MPRVIIATADEDRTIAQDIAKELQNYVSSVGILADEPRTAQQSVATAGALVIVAGERWLDTLNDNPVLRDAVVRALGRSDLLVHLALIPGGEIPAVTALPGELQSIAYMQSTHVNPAETLPRDVRRIGLQLAAHLDRATPSPATNITAQPIKQNRGLPWHILIIATAIIAGLLFILIPNLRGDREEANPADDFAAPMSSAQNAAIITPRDGLMIGVAAGLSGAVAEDGEAMVNGVRLALQGRPTITVDGETFTIDLLTQDSGCTPEGGIQAAETFTTNFTSMPGVIGHMCNISCFPASGIYDENNLATISPACDAPGLTAFEGFNRTVPSQVAAAEAIAADLVADGMTMIAVISDEEVLGTQVADAFALAITTAGGTVSTRIEVSSRTLDADALAADLSETTPDLIYFAGRAPAAAQIWDAMDVALLEIPFMLAHTVDLAAFSAETGPNSDGVLTYAPIPPQGENITVLTERYTAAFPDSPVPDGLIHAYAYDATNILLTAVEAVGEVDVVGNLLVDRDALQGYLRAYTGNGITGAYGCSGDGDCASVDVTALVVQNGQARSVDTP